MRLYTRRDIWRAFPELDRYSDDQCRRFVQSAKGSWPRRARGGLLVFLAGAAAAALCLWALSALSDNNYYDMAFIRGWVGALGLLLMLLTVTAPFFTGLITRDWLLSRRVRHVLRVRGVCIGCRYTLVGLPVGPDNRITCPECGVTTETDPSLGDLVTDDQGRTRYRPIEHPTRPPRIFTPKRVRIIKRTTISLLIGVPSLCALLWGAWEVFLTNQADTAKKDRLTTEALTDFVLKGQGTDVSLHDPNAFNLLDAMLIERARLDAAFDTKFPPLKRARAHEYVSFGMVCRTDYEPYDEDDQLETEIIVRRTRAMLDDCRQSKLYDLLDEFADCPIAVNLVALDPLRPAWATRRPEVDDLLMFGGMCGARMEVARECNDMHEWRRAFNACRALASAARAQAFIDDAWAGVSIDAVASGQAVRLLKTHPPDDVLAELESALNHHAPLPFTNAVEGERLIRRDTLAWVFADPTHVRYERWSPALKGMFNSGIREHPLGTYRQNLAQLNRVMDEFVDRSTRQPYEWLGSPAPGDWLGKDGYGPICFIAPRYYGYFSTENHGWSTELNSRGLHTLIALEHYRNAHTDYPQSLDQLVPTFLPALPIDPWSGKPLGYVRTDPTTDPKARAFLLYSVGHGVDNGGAEPPPESSYARSILTDHALGAQYDYIINDQ